MIKTFANGFKKRIPGLEVPTPMDSTSVEGRVSPSWNEVRDRERTDELKKLFVVASLYLGVPLWIVFLAVDWFCWPSQKWIFIWIRMAGVILSLSSKPLMQRYGTSSFRIQVFGVLHCFCHNLLVTSVIFMTGGAESIYLVALNLVVVAALTFLPWTTPFLVVNAIVSYGPYYLGLLFFHPNSSSIPLVIANAVFNVSVILVAIATRIISGRLRQKELYSRILLSEEISLRDAIIKQKTEEAVKLELQASLGRQATQVAHDIRSPLSAFRTIASDLYMLPEKQRVILRSAIQRMTRIADTLQNRKKENLLTSKISGTSGTSGTSESNEETTEKLAIVSSLSEMIAEKEVEYRAVSGLSFHLKVDPGAYSLFSKVDESEFKRLLSNLLNNSVEALGFDKNIYLNVSSTADWVSIEVNDRGKGIPAELLPSLGTRGVTYGKKSGQGLGLYHARTQVESWGGQLNIVSTLGVGTSITITLPRVESPSWFCEKILISRKMKVIIVDDEPSIHLAWNYRFEKLNTSSFEIECMSFYSPDLLCKWIDENPVTEKDPLLFLIDYEFAKNQLNGLDLIEKLKIAKKSILVSSRYFEEPVLSQCKSLCVSVLPKLMAGQIPIEITTEE